MTAKCKRAPIQQSNRKTVYPLEPVHVDVLGSMKTISIGYCSCALGVIDDYTAYSEVFILSNREQVFEEMCKYMGRAERMTGHRIQSIRLDGTGEHRGEIVPQLKK